MTKPLADVRLCPCNKTENSLSITARHFTLFWPNTYANDPNPGLGILIMYVFVMYNMCLFIFEEKAEVQNPESNQSVIRPEIKIDATYDLFH